MNKDHELGKSGEDIAANYLKRLGYKIKERNFECKQGEIDIIALHKEELVFIEVKTRTNTFYAEASESVNKFKIKHLLNSIKYYIYKRNLQDEYIRRDIIEVYINGENIKINHIKQAIE